MHASRLLHLPVPSHRQSPGPGLDGVSKGLWAITAMNLARMRRLWIAGLALAMLAGCSSLPRDVERPVSHALSQPQQTKLGQWVQERRPATARSRDSGFQLLGSPETAFASRIALIEAAQKTLDIQYYAIHADATLSLIHI